MISDTSNLPDTMPSSPTEKLADNSFASHLRGFGPVGIIAILLIILTGNVTLGKIIVLPIGAALALLWVRLSRTPWSEIGYVRPRSWIGTLTGGFALGILFKIMMKVIVMPLLGADPINQSYHFLAGNKGILPMAILTMLVAGVAEETTYRGYLFERLGKLFGTSTVAKISIVLLTSLWFGIGHYGNMGLTGMAQAIITGLVFSTIYARTGKLFMLMGMHAAYDLASLGMIYCDVEADFAHFIFK